MFHSFIVFIDRKAYLGIFLIDRIHSLIDFIDRKVYFIHSLSVSIPKKCIFCSLFLLRETFLLFFDVFLLTEAHIIPLIIAIDRNPFSLSVSINIVNNFLLVFLYL